MGSPQKARNQMKELRESMVLNTAREYIQAEQAKICAYQSIFKNKHCDSDYIIIGFADYTAKRINQKLETTLTGCEIGDWYFVERQYDPEIQPSKITIAQLSALTIIELAQWLSDYNNRNNIRVM